MAETASPSATKLFIFVRFFLLGFLILMSASAAIPSRAQDAHLTVEKIMQDPGTWIGGWPSMPFWHESGDTLYFWWNPGGIHPADSLYRVTLDQREPAKASPREVRTLGPIFDGWHHGEYVYDGDFERKVYEHEGEIWLYEIPTERKHRLTQTRARESDPRFSADGEAIIFRRDDNLFGMNSEGQVRQLTDLRSGKDPDLEDLDAQDAYLRNRQEELFDVLRERIRNQEAEERRQERAEQEEAWPPVFYFEKKRVEQLQIDPAERWVTFFLTEGQPEEKRTAVPAYVTESGYVETLNARAKVGYPPEKQAFFLQDLRRDTTLQVDLHTIPGVGDSTRALHAYGPYWSADGQHAVMEVRTWDNKDRWIVRFDPEAVGRRESGDVFEILDHQHDDAWIQAPGISSQGGRSTVGWLPDGRTFFFQSEASGRSHLYTVDVRSGHVRQLTHGDFDVYDPMVSRDGRSWYFGSSEHSAFERHFYRMPIEGGERTRMTTKAGSSQAALHPDEDRMAVLHSYTTRPPEIFLKGIREDADAEQVTFSTTDEWDAYPWRDPELITIRASDGVDVPAQIFLPEEPNGAAVLFVHGAGYLQNVHHWWSLYFREYMFHNLLADEGYVVMNVDYRGSSGYGRDWRTSVYRHMGGRDLQDYVDASRYLQSEHGIDPERIFIYGGSYGGFITLMALFTEPEHFGGGAALRAVTDWAHYHYGYTANILNTPMDDTLAYARSSPIYFAEGLEDPLLIAHGMVDRNVHFQDVVRLAQRLIELGKEDWELAVYPLEGHGFEEPESWTDEYRRVLRTIRMSVGPSDAAAAEVPILQDADVPE